jgi:hypothetical protein
MIFESDDDRRVFFEANRRFLGRALFSPEPGYSRGQTQDLAPGMPAEFIPERASKQPQDV